MSAVGDVLSALLVDVGDALAAAGRPAGRSAVVAGAVAWDECCDGYLYAAAARLFDSQRFPTEDLAWTPCLGPSPAAELVVGLLRCAPTLGEDGTPPTSAALTASSLALYDDAAVIAAAIQTALCEADIDAVIAGQTFIGAEGGCVGVETRLIVAL